MSDQPNVLLNDGRKIPQIGLGVFQMPPEDTERLTATAIAVGYRSVDTAAFYRNEDGVGAAIKASGKDVFVTSKLWIDDFGYDKALAGLDRTLANLGRDSIDLYLLHWPAPARDLYVESWKALIKAREEGKVRSIGVSNFLPEHLDRIIGETGVVPAVNQVELNPGFQQQSLREYHAAHGIATESWAPLGRGRLLEDATIAKIAEKHGRTVPQVLIRWHIESGLIVIPKTSSEARLRENLAALDFRLDEVDMAVIAAMDDPDGRHGPDPRTLGE